MRSFPRGPLNGASRSWGCAGELRPLAVGYLDTGADDVVFGDARMVELVSSWWYVLVEAGPDQAAQWRQDLTSWRAPGPDPIFPAARTWKWSLPALRTTASRM
jgi:hypothetical protein